MFVLSRVDCALRRPTYRPTRRSSKQEPCFHPYGCVFFTNTLNGLCKCLILRQDSNQKNSSCPRILASEMLISIRRLTSLLTVQTSERLSPSPRSPYSFIKRTSASRVDHLLNCIKGGGACHLREKVLAEAANTSVFSFSLS